MMKRSLLIVMVTLWVWVGSIVALLASIEQRDYFLRGVESPLSDVALPDHLPMFGVNADLTQYTTDNALNAQLALMTDAGVRWVRQIVDWRKVEPTEGVYEWDEWDRIINALDDNPQLSFVPVFVNAPQWATSTACDSPCDGYWFVPDASEPFSRFIRVFSERFGDSIRYYQIWDEPNIRLAWGNQDPSPAQYAMLLSEAYQTLHAVDPDALVIAAALAPTTEIGPQNLSDLLYLDALYALGLQDFSDAIAGKPFGFDLPPDDRNVSNDVLNFSRLVALRDIMIGHSDGDKALWVSAFGWNSLPDDWQGQPSIWEAVSPQEQISYTLNAIQRAETEWAWLGGMILSIWQPNAPTDDPRWGYALVDPQGEPTPLLDALMDRQTVVNTATNGRYRADTPFATYHGAWVLNDFGADIGWVNDNQVEFRFSGEAVGLITRQDDYVTNLYITIDEKPANQLPRDPDNNAFLLLRSDTLQPETVIVTVASDLSNAEHTMVIRADELIPDETVHRWPIIGYAVQAEDLSAPYQRHIVASLITVAFMTLAVVMVTVAQVRLLRLGLTHPLSRGVQLMLGIVTSLALTISMFITWHDSLPALFRREPVQIALSLVTSGLLYWNSLGLPVALILAFALFVLIYNDIKLGLWLIIFWSPFFLFPVELYLFAFPMVEIVLLITVAAWMLKAVSTWGAIQRGSATNESHRFAWRPLDVVMLVFVGMGVIALTNSTRFSLALTDFRTLILQPALFYAMLRTTQMHKRDIMILLSMLVASAAIISAIGFFQMATGTFIQAEGGARRMASVYGSPNNVALFLGRVFPFALAIGFIVKRRYRVISSLIVAGIGLALLLTLSAGTLFIGLPVALSTMIVLYFGKKALLPLGVLAMLAVAGLLIATQIPRFERLTDFTSGTNFYRIRVWESALNMIEGHALMGIGLDQFLYEYRGEYIMPDAWEEPELSHPHNVVLDFWLRFGVLGVLWLVVSQFLFWREVRRAWRMTPDNRLWLIGLSGSMAYLLAHGLVDNSIFVIDLAYVFILLFVLPILFQKMKSDSVAVTEEISV